MLTLIEWQKCKHRFKKSNWFWFTIWEESKGCPIALMAVGEVDVKAPTWVRHWCNWGGVPLLFLATFPSSDKNPDTHYCLVNSEGLVLNLGHSAPVTSALTNRLQCLSVKNTAIHSNRTLNLSSKLEKTKNRDEFSFFFLSPWQSGADTPQVPCQEWCRAWPTESKA